MAVDVYLKMRYTVQPASLDDIPLLSSLVNSAYRGESSRKGWTTEADLLDGTRIDETALLELLQRPDTVIMLCKDQSRLLGCVELRKEGEKMYLGMLSVHPESQGSGIGKLLLQAGDDYALSQQCSTMYMTVISVRQTLIDWYVRHGYQLTGERKPFIIPDERWGIPKQHLEFVVLKKKLSL